MASSQNSIFSILKNPERKCATTISLPSSAVPAPRTCPWSKRQSTVPSAGASTTAQPSVRKPTGQTTRISAGT